MMVCALEMVMQREREIHIDIYHVNKPLQRSFKKRQLGTFHFVTTPVMFFKTFSLHTLLTIRQVNGSS